MHIANSGKQFHIMTCDLRLCAVKGCIVLKVYFIFYLKKNDISDTIVPHMQQSLERMRTA